MGFGRLYRACRPGGRGATGRKHRAWSLNRAVDLHTRGAIAEQDLEVAEDIAEDANVTLATATEHLRLLGNDPDKPMGMVDIVAPTTGVITDQEVTNAATMQAYSSPGPFTISDISSIWIV